MYGLQFAFLYDKIRYNDIMFILYAKHPYLYREVIICCLTNTKKKKRKD